MTDLGTKTDEVWRKIGPQYLEQPVEWHDFCLLAWYEYSLGDMVKNLN